MRTNLGTRLRRLVVIDADEERDRAQEAVERLGAEHALYESLSRIASLRPGSLIDAGTLRALGLPHEDGADRIADDEHATAFHRWTYKLVEAHEAATRRAPQGRRLPLAARRQGA